MPTVYERALELHEKNKGKLSVVSKVAVKNKDDLSLAYSPGVAEPCRKIAANKEDVYKYTSKGNLVAVITDGTAVLGLGDIGPEAALPVMEGKCVLFKEFAGVDAIPINNRWNSSIRTWRYRTRSSTTSNGRKMCSI